MQLKQSNVNSNIFLYQCFFLLFEIGGEISLPYFWLYMYRHLLNFFRVFSEAKLHLKFVLIFVLDLILFMILFIFSENIHCGNTEKSFLKFCHSSPSHLQAQQKKCGLWKSWDLKISNQIDFFFTVTNRTSCKNVKNRILKLNFVYRIMKNKISRS